MNCRNDVLRESTKEKYTIEDRKWSAVGFAKKDHLTNKTDDFSPPSGALRRKTVRFLLALRAQDLKRRKEPDEGKDPF